MHERKLCPECGADMVRLDPVGHAFTHWGVKANLPATSKEALRRYELTEAGGVSEAEYAKLRPEGRG